MAHQTRSEENKDDVTSTIHEFSKTTNIEGDLGESSEGKIIDEPIDEKFSDDEFYQTIESCQFVDERIIKKIPKVQNFCKLNEDFSFKKKRKNPAMYYGPDGYYSNEPFYE